MDIILIGENQEILHLLVQHINGIETKMVSDIRMLEKYVTDSNTTHPELILFDLNSPIIPFQESLNQVKNKFPDTPMWTLFESKSITLRNELKCLGFSKIISYQDNLADLLSNFIQSK